jgi:hypothetical protein
MADKPEPRENDREELPDADKRFQETLGRLVNTPHKPHKSPGAAPRRSPKPKTT